MTGVPRMSPRFLASLSVWLVLTSPDLGFPRRGLRVGEEE